MSVTIYDYNSSNNGSKNSINNKKNSTSDVNGMNDGGKSSSLRNKAVDKYEAGNLDSEIYRSILHSHNIYDNNEIDLFHKTYRYGVFNPSKAVSNTKEFLFFTKPDLHIFERDDETGLLTGQIVEGLKNIPYWVDLVSNRKRIVELLQSSYNDRGDNFNHLLQNQVISNLEIPGLSAETIETPTNMYGVGFSYRGSSEASDDSFDFSLEFKDGRDLDTYFFFKTYEEYETLKHHGVIRPYKHYIENKIIHDQFSIYKFLVDEDMETIIYYAKFYGVMPKSLPRDVFSTATFDNGISYSIDFRAAFFEDMRPDIIADFNALSKPYYNSLPYRIDNYNNLLGHSDNRPAEAAYIETVKSTRSKNGFEYKLRWRGSDNL